MLKFIVVLHRRPGLTRAEFRGHLEKVHAPSAKNLPGLKKYLQNHVCDDPKRKPPEWDAIIEPYFETWDAMGSGMGQSAGCRVRRRSVAVCRLESHHLVRCGRTYFAAVKIRK
ncbi:MAG: EthD domain-containing protein [Terriglobales bacterium]